MRQWRNRVLDKLESLQEPALQVAKRCRRHAFQGEVSSRQTELSSKLLQRHHRHSCLLQRMVRGPPDGWKIVHQRSGPIEDHIANHRGKLSLLAAPANAGFTRRTSPKKWKAAGSSRYPARCWFLHKLPARPAKPPASTGRPAHRPGALWLDAIPLHGLLPNRKCPRSRSLEP